MLPLIARCRSIDNDYFSMYLVPYYIGTIFFQGLILSNGQNRVHPEARWPKPGTPFHASPRAPSYWPTPAQIRLWPNLKRVHPILPNHPPIGYPISITPTRLWPGYSTSRRVIAGRGGAFLRSTWSCVRQNFNFRCAVCM